MVQTLYHLGNTASHEKLRACMTYYNVYILVDIRQGGYQRVNIPPVYQSSLAQLDIWQEGVDLFCDVCIALWITDLRFSCYPLGSIFFQVDMYPQSFKVNIF